MSDQVISIDDIPTEEKKKKRVASVHLEEEAPKKGKGAPAVNSAWDVDSSSE